MIKSWVGLQGIDAVSPLKERLRAQLAHVAAANRRCLLCLEGAAHGLSFKLKRHDNVSFHPAGL